MLALAPPAFAQGAKTSSPIDTDVADLKPGQFIWNGDLAPEGPMTVIVHIPTQRAYVYRNGIRIGVTTVSTGKAGHKTPTGIFTILQTIAVRHTPNSLASSWTVGGNPRRLEKKYMKRAVSNWVPVMAHYTVQLCNYARCV